MVSQNNWHLIHILFQFFITSNFSKKVQQYVDRLLLEGEIGGKEKLKLNSILGKISKKTHELKFSTGVEFALYPDYDHK